MGYSRSDIISRCTEAFVDKSTFYKKGFINYRGKTIDTGEYYTEVIAEFLCERIDEYVNGIESISRKSSYKVDGHDGVYDPSSNREEEKIAMQIFVQSRDHGAFDLIGIIKDYQTPLKSTADDDAGKIDLLSFDGQVMRILELKKPDSNETMLRCVLEGFTYMKTADCSKLISDFGHDSTNVIMKASPFIFFGGDQHKEMSQPRPHLRKLMALLDSKPYYIVEIKTANYTVVEG